MRAPERRGNEPPPKNGGNDPGSPPEHAERIAAEYGGPVTTVVYPDGVHILNNVWYQARPLVADWLAETL